MRWQARCGRLDRGAHGIPAAGLCLYGSRVPAAGSVIRHVVSCFMHDVTSGVAMGA